MAIALLLALIPLVDGVLARLLADDPKRVDVVVVSELHGVLVVLAAVYLVWARERPGTRPRSLRAWNRGALSFLTGLVAGVAALTALTRLSAPGLDPFLITVFAVTAFLWLRPREALLVFVPGATLLAMCIVFVPQSPVAAVANLANLGVTTISVLVAACVLDATRTRAVLQQVVIEQQSLDLAETNARLETLAWSDPVTGLANRRAFDRALILEWKRAVRQGSQLAMVMADIDWFKAYNDTYGHPVGDRCLKSVACAIQGALRRPGDVVARYGGEEFGVILPDTGEAGARMVAEAIREAVRDAVIPHAASAHGRVTISLGVAACVPTPTRGSPDELVMAADCYLYAAKAAGRDCVFASAVGPARKAREAAHRVSA